MASEPCDHLLAPTFAQLSGRHYINTNKAPAGATESKQGKRRLEITRSVLKDGHSVLESKLTQSFEFFLIVH